jgi:hypothetical protein
MRNWVIIKKIYEGFPLFLRRPADFDIEKLRPSFPILAIVTHQFTKRKDNGLPEEDYNLGLANMDRALITAFDVDFMGVPALIETFGGERNYYFYVSEETDVSNIISSMSHLYPSEKLSLKVKRDADWSFIEKYAKEYF